MSVSRVEDLTIRVDTGRWSSTVVDGARLNLAGGTVTALLGDSGSGKSMLAKALAGALPATADVSGTLDVPAVAYVPQSGADAFSSAHTVGEQLRDIARRHGTDLHAACDRALYPADRLDLYVEQHSGGEIDRAALAAGFLAAPQLLIVDEPSSSVDDGLAEVIWSTLGGYPSEIVPGAAVLVITSDIGLMSASGVVDRIVMLRDGRVVVDDEAAAVLGSDDAYVSRFLGAYLGR